MDHLLAKVSDRRNQYRRMISGKKIYKIPQDLSNCMKYAAEDVLDEEEWFYIDNFSTSAFCIELLKQDYFNSTDYLDINKVEPEKINYLVAYQDDNAFLFQRVYISNMLHKKRFIHIGDDVEIRESNYGIIINDDPDAIYMKDRDYLYFKKLETIAPIFRGIDELYREATEDETKEFLNYDFIDLKDGFSVELVKKSNRRRIALATKILDEFTEAQINEVFQYTNEYYPDLKFNGDKFEVKNDNDLKNLLYGIEQRLYTTPITHEKRCASAVRTI